MKYFPIVFIVLLSFFIGSCVSPSVLSNKEIMLGDESANTYSYSEAIVHYKNFCRINSQLGLYRNTDRESEVLRKLAYVYSMSGNFKEAVVELQKAVSIDSAGQNALNLLDDLREMGNCRLYEGDYQSGLAILKHCVSVGKNFESQLKQDRRLSIANVYLSLGNAYSILSKYDSSSFYLNEAFRVFRNEGDDYGLMISLLKQGVNETDLCNYNNGEQLIIQSISIAKLLKLNISEHLLALGNIYSARGDYENALVYKRNALIQADSLDNKSQQIICYISLGDTYTEIGDSKSALFYYNFANDIITSNEIDKKDASAILATRKGEYNRSLNYYAWSGATYSRSITLLKIGVSYFEKQNYDSSRYYLDLIVKNTQSNNRDDVVAKTYTYKAAGIIESGSLANALNLLDSAYHMNLSPDNEWKICYYYGRVFERTLDFNKAETFYKKAISIIEDIRSKIQTDELKSSFMDKRIEVYDRLINLLNRQNKTEESFSYVEKARNRAFLDMLAKRKENISYYQSDSIFAIEERKLSSKLTDLKEKIMRFSELKDSETDSSSLTRSILLNEFITTNSEYDQFLLKLQTNNSNLLQLIKPEICDARSAISSIGNNSVILEYWLSQDKLYIYRLTKLGINLVTVPFYARSAELLYEGLVYFTKRTPKSTFYLSGLYKILIEPIRKDLPENCNLIIVPHGLLHFVPFQALIDGSQSAMVNHYFISYAPSASVLKETKKRSRQKESSLLAMAIGNLSVNGQSPLASSVAEIQDIAPLFRNAETKLENQCTKDFFTFNSGRYSYIHLATHSVYDARSPLSSYILFNGSNDHDTKLKVSDIFGLKLNANLVTLSACQTGLGNISNSDELVGLSRAFIYAGTPSIIVSLWNVADAPTAKLMSYFYDYLKNNPTNVALTLAERKLMISYKDPYYWAPFILMGNYD
jgi:Uncharacterized protein conserved in bacteria